MSKDGLELRISGSTFKVELLPLVSGILSGAAKTIVALKTGAGASQIVPNLVTTFFGALKNFKQVQTPETRAWILVSGGLLYALEKTILETATTRLPTEDDIKQLSKNLAERVATRTYTIEPDFFASPNKLELLDDVSHEFLAWIRTFGNSDKLQTLRNRLERHFPSGLHRTWMKEPDRFEPMELALNSPFTSTMKAQSERDGYLQYLEEEFTQLKLIGQDEDGPQPVKLSQVFIPLRAFYEKPKPADDVKKDMGGPGIELVPIASDKPKLAASDAPKVVVNLFDELERWLTSADRKDPFRLISGGPGIGKSSSMKALAARLARKNARYPLFIPLQSLDKPNSSLRIRIADYLINTKAIPLSESPLDIEGKPTQNTVVLIFDGLDELVRPGRDADEIARDFMNDLQRLLLEENGTHGAQPPRVLAIITGRISSADSAARALKCSSQQILSLLPFSYAQPEYHNFEDPAELLNEDQRITWWQLWHNAAANVPDTIPPLLLANDLFEVTVEPLLLYFVAFVRPWEAASEKLDRNSLYDRLLRNFYKRECDKGDRNFATEFAQFEEYEFVLQAMSFAAWYDGSTRTGSIELVQKLLADWYPDVATAFSNIVSGNKPAISAALAFYMKPGEKPNSFEFLHKTFAEYLVTRRLVDSIRQASTELVESQSAHGPRRRTFDDAQHIENWLRLTGPRSFDPDLLRFVRDEAEREFVANPQEIRHWINALTRLLQASMRDGMPAHKLFQLPDMKLVRRPQTFLEAIEQARNAEEAVLACLNACILSLIGQPDFEPVDVKLGTGHQMAIALLLGRIRGARAGPANMALSLLSGLNFSGEILHLQDFYGMQGTRIDLSGAHLGYANFSSANLYLVKMQHSHAWRCDFTDAYLAGANLEGLNGESSNFQGANLEEANLKGASLSSADFRGANLKRATLRGADLTDADLRGADLRGANLRGAKLRNADFTGAKLRDTKFDPLAMKRASIASNISQPGDKPIAGR